eukprot:gene13067-15368_t
MSVISFGVGKQGQLGHDTLKDQLDPAIVQMLKGKRIKQVACGEAHSLAVTEFGDVYSWGRGKEGELGHPERHQTMPPQIIRALEHERIVKVVCGNFHSLALTDTGKVYQWGQLHEIDNSKSGIEKKSGLVEMTGIGYAKKIADFSLSLYLNGEKMIYKTDEEALAAGVKPLDEEEESYDNREQSKDKQIGEIVDRNQLTPLLITSLKNVKIVDISAGWAFSAAVTSTGQLYCWGFNEKGQLGQGDRWYTGTPRRVASLAGVHIAKVSCGRQHMGAISDKGELYMWGLGVFGQLGQGKLKSYLRPQKVMAFAAPEGNADNKINVESIACGANYTMVTVNGGQLYAFGHGEYGQLGATEDSAYMDWNSGGTSDREDHLKYSLPKLVKALENVRIRQIACGHLHTVVLSEENDVYTWGWGASGCLGFGDKKFQLVPQRVPALSGEEISSISGGEKHTLIVRSSDISTFAFDYKPLINESKSADIVFIIQKKPIYAHKIWVAFITYLYTDHLVIAPHLRKELSELADHWQVPRLASLCHRYNYKLRQTDKIIASSFSSEITEYLDSVDFSDIYFTLANNQVVSAHRTILSSRNDYFKTMFECGFKEADQLGFEIGNDIDKETFQLIIEYIYGSNDAVVTSENAVDLLCLADRFMVNDLKLVAEHFLEQIVKSNIPNVLQFASQPNTITTTTTSIGQDESVSTVTTVCIDNNNSSEPQEEALVSFDNICLLLQVADRFLAKRLKRVCMETIVNLTPEVFTKLNKNGTMQKIRASSPQLIRELDHFASVHGKFEGNQMMTLTR